MRRALLFFALMLSACALDRTPRLDASLQDSGNEPDCTESADCDDGIECTSDFCIGGSCEFTPDDDMCPGGTCAVGTGCVTGCDQEECSASSLTEPESCRVGVCRGEACEQELTCAEGEHCCGDGTCQNCDDGNECTRDYCDSTGCHHEPLVDTPCTDDGVFCNGVERCVAGGGTSTCTSVEPPCPGNCDSVADTCQCEMNSDCTDVDGEWGSCTWGAANTAAFCDGVRSRTNKRNGRCVGGGCQWDDVPEEDRSFCRNEQTGEVCGSTERVVEGACGYDQFCDESATRTDVLRDYACNDRGQCLHSDRNVMGNCTRGRTGMVCNGDDRSVGPCNFEGNPTCDETGQAVVTITQWRCGGGTCRSQSGGTEMQGCSRETDGDSCGMITNSVGNCNYGGSNPCDGTRTRTTTTPTCNDSNCEDVITTSQVQRDFCRREREDFTCGADVPGSCNTTPGSCDPNGTRNVQRFSCNDSGSCISRNDNEACTENQDGNACNDGDNCTTGDVCSSGTCGGTAVDCMPRATCEAAMCAADGSCNLTPNHMACDDGIPCTVDACDPDASPDADGCTHTPNDAFCGGDCRTGSCDPSAANTDANGCELATVGTFCGFDPGNACSFEACDAVGDCIEQTYTCNDGDCMPMCMDGGGMMGGGESCSCGGRMGCVCR